MMSKAVRVQIKWMKYDQGGRKMPPPSGTRYCPIVIFNSYQDPEGIAWSADFICSETDADFLMTVEFSFVSDLAPYDLLIKGNTFELFEGNKKVADGAVID